MTETRDPPFPGPDPDPVLSPSSGGRYDRPPGRRRGLRHAARLALALVLVVVAVLGTLFFLLLVDEVPLSPLTPRIEASIEAQLPAGYSVEIGDTLLRRSERTAELTIELNGMTLKRDDGVPVFSVPRAAVGLSALALLQGRLSARSIRVIQPELTLVEGSSGLGLLSQQPGESGQPGHGRSWGGTSVLDGLAIVFALLKSDSGIGALQEVGVEDAALVVRRPERDARSLAPLTVLLTRKRETRAIGFDASLGEGPGAARVGGTLRETDDGGVAVEVDVANLDVRDFEPLLPSRLPFAATSPVEGRVALALSGAAELNSFSLDLTVGAGHFGPAEGEQVLVDEMTLAADWERSTGHLTIRPSTVLVGENRGTLSGEVVVPQRGDFGSGTWPVRLQLTNVRIADPEADWPAVFPLVSVEAFYIRSQNLLNVTRLDIASPEAAASLVGMVGGGAESPAIRLAGSSATVPVRALKSLWPPFLGSGARNWVVKNLHDGLVANARLNVDIGPDEIASALRGKPLPERAYRLDFDLQDVDFSYLGDMPPVTGADATATLRPGSFDLKLTETATVDVGRGEIVVNGGRFFVGDLRPKPAIGEINLSLAGSADAIAELLNYQPLELPARRGISPGQLSGSADVDIGLVMPLMKDVRFADVDVTAAGVVDDLGGDGLVPDRQITNGDVSFTIADRWLSIEGTAEIDGVPADLALRQPLESDGGGAARTITMTLDEAAQARMGLTLGGLLTGPVEATVQDIAATERGGAQAIEVDLTSARLNLPQVGLDKPAGRPAKAKFLLSQHSEGVSIEDLTLLSEGTQIEGEIEVGRDGGLVRLSLPVFRLPNGTNLSVTGRTEGGTRIFVLKGETLDLRPALGAMRSAAVEEGETERASVRLEIDVERAVGQNRTSIQDLIGSIAIGRSGVDVVDLSGRIGSGASVTAAYRRTSSPALTIRSGDAGAVVAFAGLYSHMRGGRLSVVADWQGPSGALVGSFGVDRFSISEDPAVRRLIASGEGSHGRDREAAQPQRPDSALLDPGDVRLDRMEAQFALLDGRVEVRNGVVRGTAVGATVEGQIGLGTQSLDLHGTYVPLYAINNLFQRLPVFGVLLGGKRNEGLLGITYSVRGRLESPDFTINPLSAVTPGVFRYIFQMDNPQSFDPPDRDWPRAGSRTGEPIR